MMSFISIDQYGLFDNVSQAQDFHLINSQNKFIDARFIQLNYLLTLKIDDARDFVFSSTQEKIDALSTYAHDFKDYSIFTMLQLILNKEFMPEDIPDDHRDDKVLFNRLANLGGGYLNDFSVLLELKRIIQLCLENEIIFESIDGQEDENEIEL